MYSTIRFSVAEVRVQVRGLTRSRTVLFERQSILNGAYKLRNAERNVAECSIDIEGRYRTNTEALAFSGVLTYARHVHVAPEILQEPPHVESKFFRKLQQVSALKKRPIVE
jgi:hypothetical protein